MNRRWKLFKSAMDKGYVGANIGFAEASMKQGNYEAALPYYKPI